jgi:hypothetical protein
MSILVKSEKCGYLKKFYNFEKFDEFWEKFTILTKFHNFD